jgi:peptide/nickel transport system substrate-binding protein
MSLWRRWLRLPIRAGRQASVWALSAAACAGLVVAAARTLPAAAATHPSSLGVSLEGWKPNWWAPIEPATACVAFDGGVGGGMYSYLPLLWVNGNDSINYPLSIASGISVSNDDRTYTVHLNPRWHWSNGQPVTAADVVYDFDLLKAASQPKSPLPYCFADTGGLPAQWASVTAPNETTVVIKTTGPVSPLWFELNGLAQLVPIPKATWDKYPNLNRELSWINSIADQPQNPVYQVIDGPYNISKVVPNQYWVYTWNPRYSGKKPAIHTVIYYYEASDAADFAALKTGQVQISSLPPTYWPERSQLSNYAIQTAPLFGYQFISLNLTAKAPGIGDLFSQLYVRQALQYGIDQPLLVSKVLDNLATPTISPVPSVSVYYDKAIKNPYPYDPARGKALLEAHGWKMEHGVMTRGNLKLAFKIILVPGSQSTTNELLAIIQSWAQEGIQATVQEMGANTANSITGNPADRDKWDAAMGGLWIYVPDYYPTGEDLFETNDAFNSGGYSSAEMNSLITKTLAAGTPAQLRARFDAYQRYAVQQLPGILYVPTAENVNVISKQVGGWNQNYNLIISEPPMNYLYWK